MNRAQLTSFNIVEIPRRVMLEALKTAPGGECADASEDCTLLQIRFLILSYATLTSMSGLPPDPAMLLHMGWPGQVLHVLFAEAESWRAFRTMVERSHDIPRMTSLTEGDVTFGSLRDRLVYRALRTISGVTHVEPHPLIPGGTRGERASFLVSAATGLTAFVEVAVDFLSTYGQRAISAEHRDDPLRLAELYRKAGIEPVVIWHSEVDAPRILAERLNDLRALLSLPTRPPSSATWYEEVG